MFKVKYHFLISTTNQDSKRDSMFQQAFHSTLFTRIHVCGIHTEVTIDHLNPQIQQILGNGFQNILCTKLTNHYLTDWNYTKVMFWDLVIMFKSWLDG